MPKVLMLVSGVPRMVEQGEAVVLRSPDGTRHFLDVDNEGILSTTSGIIYNETLVIGAGGVTTGTPVSLPLGETYLGEELEVKLNDVVLNVGSEYEYASEGIKTQVAFTFDLIENDELEFSKII